MGKSTICIGENKHADQLRGNRDADQRLCFRYSDSTIPLREGVKPGTNARDPGPKSGTNFYGHQKVILRATNKIRIGLSVVYRVFSMMYITVFPKISNSLKF